MARRPPTTSSVSRKCEFINKICHFWCDNKNEKTHKRQSQHQSAEPSSKIPNNQFRKYLCVFLNNFFFAAEELLMHRIVSSACSAWARGFVWGKENEMSKTSILFLRFGIRTIDKEAFEMQRFSFICNVAQRKMPPKSKPTFRPADYLSLNLPATIIRTRHKHTWIIDLLNGLYRRGSLRALLSVANKPGLTCCRRRRYFEHSATKVAPFYGRRSNERA